jgi:crossover junction endodeoxyribonuclease RusA
VESVGFELPWPPSLNRYSRHVGPRVLVSREGRQYRMKTVSRLGGLFEKFTVPVRVCVELYPPDNRRRDLDNSLKCLLDSLTHAGVYEDDSLIKDLELHMKDPVPPDGMVHVTIEER